MAKPWFRPKTFGLGATPVSWEGWAATAAFVALLAADIRMVPRAFSDRTFGLALGIGLGAALLAGFVVLTLVKGGGKWKWRWGDGD